MCQNEYVTFLALLLTVFCQNSDQHQILNIVVLDIKHDWTSTNTSSQWNYNITDRSGENLVLIQWKEIETKVQGTLQAKFIFNQHYDLWLFTSAVCKESFFLDTIVPRNISYNCLTQFDTFNFSQKDSQCSLSHGSLKMNNSNGKSVCIFPKKKMKNIKALMSIVQTLQWNHLILIYDMTTELSVEHLTDLLSDAQIKSTMYNFDSLKNKTEDLISFFDTIYSVTNYHSRNFLLVCSQSCINTVVNQANNFDENNRGATVLGLFSKWLIADIDGTTILENGCNLKIDNMVIVNFPFTESRNIYGLRKIFVTTIETKITNLQYLQEEPTEQRLLISENTTAVYDTLKNDLTTYRDCWRAEIFTLLYKTEGRVLSSVGHVNYTENVNLSPNLLIFPNTKYGFNNRVFRTSILRWYPFTQSVPNKNGTVDFIGYNMDILQVLQASLNFSVQMIEPEDGEYGRNINGSWTGAVGQLFRREVDLFIGPMAVTSERERVLDFVYPFHLAYTAVVFRLPDPNKTKWRKLISPFKWQVYVCIATSFCGVILLLYTTERLNPFYTRTKRPRSTFQCIALYLFGALINQGGTGMPSSMSGRSMLAAWWLICLILVATYSGNLIAFLTVSKEKLPLETLSDLASQKDYKWGTLGGTSWVTLFKNSNLTVYQKIWKGIQEFNKTDTGVLSSDQEYHLNKVISEDYGFIADKITAETRSSKSCKLTILKELFHPMGYTFALQNNSPYLQYFDDEIRKILESGVAQILKRPWWPKQGTCADMPTTAQIDLVDIQSAFYVIVIGISIACLTILIEGCFTKNGPVVSLRYRCMTKKTGV